MQEDHQLHKNRSGDKQKILKAEQNDPPFPEKSLNTFDAVALVVGIVVGAGIFRTPSFVAANSESIEFFTFAWVFGGIISLIGALCYAELTTAFPDTGGDYHFLKKAFGRRVAFLFAWARMSVIQTGSLALLSFIFGNYLSQIINLGNFSSEIYAAVLIIVLTGINILGVHFGSGTQKLLTIVEVLGIITIVLVGFFFNDANQLSTEIILRHSERSHSLGLAMVFVLLTFGGWNEAAYISSEIQSGKRQIVKSLIAGILIITTIYLLINLAYVKILGLEAMAQSDAVAADLMRITFGEQGVIIIAILVAVAAMTSANATIFTGARSNYALGRDFRIFSFLGRWNFNPSGPINALLVQGVISLLLVGLGFFSRSGFETTVEYTAPVFWFFFLMVGISIFILRKKEPNVDRPFKVPFYPLTPLIFCFTSAYLLYSSVIYTGWGSLAGIAILLVGVIIILLNPSNFKKA